MIGEKYHNPVLILKVSEKGPGLIFATLVVMSHELLRNVGRDVEELVRHSTCFSSPTETFIELKRVIPPKFNFCIWRYQV